MCQEYSAAFRDSVVADGVDLNYCLMGIDFEGAGRGGGYRADGSFDIVFDSREWRRRLRVWPWG